MILTLVLALLPVTERVNAVASEMAVVYFVYATIFGSCAVSFASDENFRQGVKNFVGQASEVTKNIVNAKAVEMANNIASGLQLSGYKIKFSAEEWKFITEDVNKYVSNAYNSLDSSAVTVGKDGTLGWTENSQFSVELKGGISQIALNDYTILTFNSANLTQNTFCLLPYVPDYMQSYLDEKNTSNYAYVYSFSCTPFALISYYSNICNQKFQFNGLLTSDIEKTFNSMNTLHFTFNSYITGFGATSLDVLSSYARSSYSISEYTIDGKLCFFCKCDDNKWRFVTKDTISNVGISNATDDTCVPLVNHYTNKTYYSFDSACEMYYTILDACKMRHLTKDSDGKTIESDTDVYKAPALPVSGSVPDVYTGTDNVTLTIPKTVTSVDDYTAIAEANPTDIIDYEKSIEYPDGVPKIDSSGLFDKFPFCIPKDLYNLFAGFYSSESKAPKFDIPFQILKQSDGSYLIDTSISFDFAIFDDIMPMVRWFTTAGFVFFLIMITRKMIGAQ